MSGGEKRVFDANDAVAFLGPFKVPGFFGGEAFIEKGLGLRVGGAGVACEARCIVVAAAGCEVEGEGTEEESPLEEGHGRKITGEAEKKREEFFWRCGGFDVIALGMAWLRPVEVLMRIALAGFFIWSGWEKLGDLSAFTKSVGNFKFDWTVSWGGEERNFFAEPMDAVIAYVVPWFEILAAIALMLPFSRFAGGLVLLVMLISFNVALAYAWNLGVKDLDCGCHGVSETPTNFPLKIASNFGLMAVVLGGFWARWRHHRLVRADEGSRVSA